MSCLWNICILNVNRNPHNLIQFNQDYLEVQNVLILTLKEEFNEIKVSMSINEIMKWPSVYE